MSDTTTAHDVACGNSTIVIDPTARIIAQALRRLRSRTCRSSTAAAIRPSVNPAQNRDAASAPCVIGAFPAAVSWVYTQAPNPVYAPTYAVNMSANGK